MLLEGGPMSATDLIVAKNNLAHVELIDSPCADTEPGPGQVKLRVDRFGLTSNNLSYAGAGDILGYWNFFPSADPTWGIVPVWGFATVVASNHDEIEVGEELFGYLPMGRFLIIEPHDVSAAYCSDRFAHRAELHPWYNRYYRTENDPASPDEVRHLQPLLWALHMTGWMLANQFADNDDFGCDHVIVASASSKTAVSFARSMQVRDDGPRRIGLTSTTNAAFVESLGCYDEVRTYDALGLSDVDGTAALVDMSGNAAVVSEVHHAFGDRLLDSIRIGSTHLSARGDTEGLPGPARRFFFIPDVAEQRAAEIGQGEYHAEFAASWADYGAWANDFITVVASTGPEAIKEAYLAALGGAHNPATGLILNY